MSRRLNDWITSYLEYTQTHEATDKLHFWCAAAILSASLKRQIWMNRGYYKLYPNLYVLLVAESAKARKSLAMDLAVGLLRDGVPDVSYISGSMTPEGMVKHLNREKYITTMTVNGTKTDVQIDGHCFLHADELAETFGYDKQRASRFTILLTKIYGSPAEHTHTLASEKQVSLRNLYPVFLGGTDQNNLKVLPEEAIGGLIGRTIFVNEDKRKRNIAWPSPEEQDAAAKLRALLKEDLYTISLLIGEVKPSDNARECFRAWYEDVDHRSTGDRRLDSFRERCHDTAMKLAIILSVSKSDDLIVHERQMKAAIEYIEAQAPEFQRVSDWTVASEYVQNRAKFIEYLSANSGTGSRNVAMRLLKLSLEQILVLESSLEHEHTIDIRFASKMVFYKLL